MKKLFLVAFAIATLCGCTQNQMAKQFGGDMALNLPKGEKLLMNTWKSDGSLWYLTEPMDKDYTPKTKKFKEDSNWGIMQGTVTVVESR